MFLFKCLWFISFDYWVFVVLVYLYGVVVLWQVDLLLANIQIIISIDIIVMGALRNRVFLKGRSYPIMLNLFIAFFQLMVFFISFLRSYIWVLWWRLVFLLFVLLLHSLICSFFWFICFLVWVLSSEFLIFITWRLLVGFFFLIV